MDLSFFKDLSFREFTRAGGVLAGTLLVTFAVRRLIGGLSGYVIRGLRDDAGRPDLERAKQVNTVTSVVRKVITVTIVVLGVLLAVRELGYDTAPLFALTSVLLVAAGFGAQHLMRDVISGFFLIAEGQIRVNDNAVINDTAGTVEQINLRTTVLRDGAGAVHVFSNGNILKLANRTREYSYFVFTLQVSYKDNPEQALEILSGVIDEMRREPTHASDIWGALEIIGVESLGAPAMVVKARVKTQPGRQWAIGFEAHRRLKHKFQDAGLEFPTKGGQELK
jgi:small conductance mechanosensitive channel